MQKKKKTNNNNNHWRAINTSPLKNPGGNFTSSYPVREKLQKQERLLLTTSTMVRIFNDICKHKFTRECQKKKKGYRNLGIIDMKK